MASSQIRRVCFWVLLVPFALATTLTPLGFSGLNSAAGSPAVNAPIGSVSVDSNGNLLVNGEPFLLIMGETVEYGAWQEAGYSLAEANAKLRQLRSVGVNTLSGVWIGVPPYGIADQADTAWTVHNFFWSGSATLDYINNVPEILDRDGRPKYGTPEARAVMAQIVDNFKARPYLLRWSITPELASDLWNPEDYASAVRVIHSRAPQVVGETHVLTVPPHPWTDAVGATLSQVPFGEAVLGGFGSSGASIATLYYDGLRLIHMARAAGKQFVPAISTTPLPELLAENAALTPRVPTQAEVNRYFLLQVAMGVRAFSILWGPNIREKPFAPNTGDVGLPPGYLETWNWTLQAVDRVNGLRSVILDPAPFARAATNPAFSQAFSAESPPYRGVYASKKTVGGATYVIAVNMNMTDEYRDIPVPRATVDVGFPIGSVTRLFETGSVSFSGRTITDSFAPMAVHVYKLIP